MRNARPTNGPQLAALTLSTNMFRMDYCNSNILRRESSRLCSNLQVTSFNAMSGQIHRTMHMIKSEEKHAHTGLLVISGVALCHSHPLLDYNYDVLSYSSSTEMNRELYCRVSNSPWFKTRTLNSMHRL